MSTDMVAPKKRRRRGEGGISRRADGRYVVRVELPRDPVTGERRQRVRTAMNEDEAIRKLNKLKHDLIDLGDLPTGSETVSKWLEYWMREVDRSRPKTRAGYRSKIKYIDKAIGNLKLDMLTPADVRKVETHIVKKLKLSPTSALQAYQVLARSLRAAEREGRVSRNVARLIDPPRKAAPKLNILTPEEAITVIGSVTKERLGSRVAAALLLGARQGELLGLEWDRVHFDENTIDFAWQLQRIAWTHGCDRVRGDQWSCGHKRGTDCPERWLDAPSDWEHRHLTGGLYLSRPKSKAGWRVIPMADWMRAILLRRAEESVLEPNPYGLVWTADPKRSKATRAVLPLDGSPIDPSRDNAAWHDVLSAAGVTDVRLHDARHTTVSLLYDLDVPETVIQEIVGQSTLTSTRGYRHKNMRLSREALEAVGQRLGAQLQLTSQEAALPLE